LQEPLRPAQAALAAVIQEAYAQGVSIRSAIARTKAPDMNVVSKRQLSRL
jgi:putative transposase